MRFSRGLLLGMAACALACKSDSAGPSTPPAIAIVNRSNAVYAFGVYILAGPTQVDTLQHSTGNDSVCTTIPAAGSDYEQAFGAPGDTANPKITSQLFVGSTSKGWLLHFGPKAVGNDTLVLTLTAANAC